MENLIGPRSTIVDKYGGTSLDKDSQVDTVAHHAIRQHKSGQRVVIVVSARGKETDELQKKIVACGGEHVDQKILDFGMPTGEELSAACVAASIAKQGGSVAVFNGSQIGLIARGTFGDGKVVTIKNPEVITRALDEGKIVVLAAYAGVNNDNEKITLGRGGSDTFAVAVAAAIKAAICRINTDVPCIFCTNPRWVPNARPVRHLTYLQVLDIAQAGAEVLKERSVELAQNLGVPIQVLLSPSFDAGKWSESSREGTVITTGASLEDMEATRMSQTLMAVSDDIIAASLADLPNHPGILKKIFTELKGHVLGDISQALTARKSDKSVLSFQFQKRQKSIVQEALDRLQIKSCRIGMRENLSTLTVIDRTMRNAEDWHLRVVSALADNEVNIEMINSAGFMIWTMVNKEDGKKAAKALAEEFDLVEK